ncbi:hypothetical protein KEM48_000233 [Puccinia striiformis f. sp. tritici PST-130]|nr:hypothetical protein KEM48_000233 [Puccinia striiformis f. sp. tritici PST-130]
MFYGGVLTYRGAGLIEKQEELVQVIFFCYEPSAIEHRIEIRPRLDDTNKTKNLFVPWRIIPKSLVTSVSPLPKAPLIPPLIPPPVLLLSLKENLILDLPPSPATQTPLSNRKI